MSDLLINIEVKGGSTAKKALTDIHTAAKQAATAIDSLQKELNQQPKTIQEETAELKKLKQQLGSTTQQVKALEAEVSKLNKQLDTNTSKHKKASTETSKLSGIFNTVKAAAVGYATVLIAMKIQQFITDTIEAGVRLDSLQRSFKAITGDATSAATEMQFVAKTADTLGLQLTTLEDSYKNILAASKNTTLEGQNVRDIFTAINKAAAVLGMSADDTTGSLRALTQMISKGTVQSEELKNQLGERLPGAFQMVAEAMKVSTSELNKMLENGQVLAEDLIPKLADVLEKRLGAAAEDAGNRAQASFNRFKNALELLQREISDAGALDALVGTVDALTAAMKTVTPVVDDVGEAYSALWDIMSAVPTGVLRYFKELSAEEQKLQQQTNDLIETFEDYSLIKKFTTVVKNSLKNAATTFSGVLESIGVALGAVVN
jgi:tape measure domain-containing protein